jgi:Mycobacterium membrane protein
MVFRLFNKAWMPSLVVVVIVLGLYAIVRIRDTLGAHTAVVSGEALSDDTKPFNPKHITYEITSPAGGTVNLDWLDENGQAHCEDTAPIPQP